MSTAAAHALDELYRRHAHEVYRYAYAVLGNRADAEDVTQTTFVNALRAFERGQRPRKPSSWLITIAHNIVRERFRQQGARPTEVQLEHDPPAPTSADEGRPTIEELVQALQRIPQSQREALVLRELEGRSYDEIAQILARSKASLETLLFRARRSLADELENAVTCERAALDLSRQLDGRLSRKERRRLNDHLAECSSCRRLQAAHARRRRAFGGLALLPLPPTLTTLRDASTAAAGSGPTPAGAYAPTTLTGSAAVGIGTTTGGLALGAAAVAVMAVLATTVATAGSGYVRPPAAGLHDAAAPNRATTSAIRRAASKRRSIVSSPSHDRTAATRPPHAVAPLPTRPPMRSGPEPVLTATRPTPAPAASPQGTPSRAPVPAEATRPASPTAPATGGAPARAEAPPRVDVAPAEAAAAAEAPSAAPAPTASSAPTAAPPEEVATVVTTPPTTPSTTPSTEPAPGSSALQPSKDFKPADVAIPAGNPSRPAKGPSP